MKKYMQSSVWAIYIDIGGCCNGTLPRHLAYNLLLFQYKTLIEEFHDNTSVLAQRMEQQVNFSCSFLHQYVNLFYAFYIIGSSFRKACQI